MGQTKVPLCLPLLSIVFVISCNVSTFAQQASQETQVKTNPSNLTGQASQPIRKVQLPMLAKARDLTKLVLPTIGRNLLQTPLPFAGDPADKLRNAIMNKLGIRYRFYGTSDSGYDCSGLVWRVFQEAGANFQRVAARTLWSQLPEVTAEEAKQFGTLVFFNDLKHVGIVRDDKTFFHASSSKGVTISEFSGYWEKRITGYRKAPMALLPHILQSTAE